MKPLRALIRSGFEDALVEPVVSLRFVTITAATIMISSMPPLHLRLPATSANLGPGFDTLGLAMALYLTLDAQEAPATVIRATGRNSDLTADPANSLIVTTYRDLLVRQGVSGPDLDLTLHNDIPLGMGCGSSAAAILAGVHLANHFGPLGWNPHQVLTEACRREGHPDNVAACALGGLAVSTQHSDEISAATMGYGLPWKLLLALPGAPLSTEKARAVLPASYSRADTVGNIQRSSLLVAAFALGRADLLQRAMEDAIHQPFRAECCPLLPRLLPLAGRIPGVYGAALSGAGPSVLFILDPGADRGSIERAIRESAEDFDPELLLTEIAGPTVVTVAP